MRYTYFEFENFKGITKSRLNLAAPGSSARVYTLVGLNESGKTTVLEGMDIFQADDEVSPKQLGKLEPVDLHSLIPIGERTNFNGDIIVRCGVELDEADIAAAKSYLHKEYDGFRLESIQPEIVISDHYRYEDSRYQARHSMWIGPYGLGYKKTGSVKRKISYKDEREAWVKLTQFVRDRLPSIWFFPNFLFDFPERIYIEEVEGEKASNRFYRTLFQDILNALDRDLDVNKHIVDRYRSGVSSDKTNLHQVLLEAARHVTSTVVASWNQIFGDKLIGQKRVLIEIGNDQDEMGVPGPIWVEFRIEDTDGLFRIRERSLGFRWFFVYLMLTRYRGRRKETDNNMLYLFDEPASNLHPTAQGMLLHSLSRLSSDAVVIYTTHSHYLIEPAWLGNTSVVANRGLGEEAVSTEYTAGRTDITITPYHAFAGQHPNQSHYFQPILDVLDYSPSAIGLAPEATMVEGKSDFYLFRYFEEVILGRPAQARLSWMPGGGAGSLDELIQLYIGWARPFVALLDSDSEGKSQKRRYIDKFGPIVEGRLVLLAEACGRDVRGIEGLLTEADMLAFQRIVVPESTQVDKKCAARGVQEALVTKYKIELSTTAHAALEATIEYLRQKLTEE